MKLEKQLKERYFGTLSSAFKNENDAEMFLTDINLFITDLRKQDEAELIKMLPVKNGRTEQLIKDYYAK